MSRYAFGLLLLQTVLGAPVPSPHNDGKACSARKAAVSVSSAASNVRVASGVDTGAAASTATCPTEKTLTVDGKVFTIECATDRRNGNLPAPNGAEAASFEACIASCASRDGCVAAHWLDQKSCYLKGEVTDKSAHPGVWGAVLNTAAASSAPAAAAPAPSAAVQAEAQPVRAPAPVVSSAPAPAPVASSPIPDPIVAASPAADKGAAAVPQKGSAPYVAPVASAAASVAAAISSVVAPAPAASSPAAVASTSSSGTCARPAAKKLSTKRGISYTDAAATDLFGNKISWAYNWQSVSGDGFNKKLMYMPMLWSTKDAGDAWTTNANAAIAAGADTLLGPNEPDHQEQANMSPALVAEGWKKSMEPLKCKARLAAPAVTNGQAPMGLTWLKQFFDACTDCTIDVVPIHWYSPATAIDYFKQYVAEAKAAAGGRPLWITEFGATGSDAEIKTFFDTVLPWLDQQDYVERYAYFMAAPGYLTQGTDRLSAIGDVYNSL